VKPATIADTSADEHFRAVLGSRRGAKRWGERIEVHEGAYNLVACVCKQGELGATGDCHEGVDPLIEIYDQDGDLAAGEHCEGWGWHIDSYSLSAFRRFVDDHTFGFGPGMVVLGYPEGALSGAYRKLRALCSDI